MELYPNIIKAVTQNSLFNTLTARCQLRNLTSNDHFIVADLGNNYFSNATVMCYIFNRCFP